MRVQPGKEGLHSQDHMGMEPHFLTVVEMSDQLRPSDATVPQVGTAPGPSNSLSLKSTKPTMLQTVHTQIQMPHEKEPSHKKENI